MESQILKRSYSEKEAAQYIGMSRSFLRQSRMSGNRDGKVNAPPFRKVGRKVIYLKEELDAWLDHFPKLEHLAQLTHNTHVKKENDND